MQHLTFMAGDRAVHGYPATDLDLEDDEAAYLLGATHSDGSPIYMGGSPAVEDEGADVRLARRNLIKLRTDAAAAADAAYLLAHSSPAPQAAPTAAASPPVATPLPTPTPAPVTPPVAP